MIPFGIRLRADIESDQSAAPALPQRAIREKRKMAMLQLFRIETFCGIYWTGAGYSHDELDAETFMTADEALSEIENLGLQDVYAEKFERYSARAPKIYASTAQEIAA